MQAWARGAKDRGRPHGGYATRQHSHRWEGTHASTQMSQESVPLSERSQAQKIPGPQFPHPQNGGIERTYPRGGWLQSLIQSNPLKTLST